MAQRDSSLDIAHITDELLVFTPIFSDFDPQRQIHPSVQAPFDFLARCLANLLQAIATLADDDALLRVALDIDRSLYMQHSAVSILQLLDHDRRLIRYFLLHQ